MKKEQLFEEIGKIDDEIITDSDKKISFTSKRKLVRFVAAAAACLVLVAAAGLPTLLGSKNKIALTSSYGVKAKVVSHVPKLVQTSMDLVSLTQEEIFAQPGLTAFRGTVEKLENVQLNFNGEKEYKAIATVKVEKLYSGNMSVGESVEILLPCSVNMGEWVEDTGTVSAMRVGTKGIFLPVAYTAENVYETNGARLTLSDLAPYGFNDGERFAFVETADGLVYGEFAYPSLSGAKTLDEVESFVQKMLG